MRLWPYFAVEHCWLGRLLAVFAQAYRLAKSHYKPHLKYSPVLFPAKASPSETVARSIEISSCPCKQLR